MPSSTSQPAAPQAPEDLAAAVAAALARNDFDRADALARRGLLSGVEHPLFLNVVAFSLERAGRLDDAFRLLERARVLAPQDSLTLASLGHWYSKAGRPGEALKAFDAALALNPVSASAHHGRGLALAAVRDFEGALACQTRALEFDPRNADVLAALAGMEANLGRNPAARRHAEAALEIDPANAAALVVLGALAFQAGEAEETVGYARRALQRGDLTGLHASAAQRLMADALDALGRYDEAFEAYSAANQILRTVHQAVYQLEGVEKGPELCRRLIGVFSGVEPGSWTAPAAPEREPPVAAAHVFLVGFPRSGTTLLEQVLATHDHVVALEERQTMDDIGLDFFDRDTIHRLFEMDAVEAADLRRRYWENVRRFGVEPAGRMFVDKLPLNSLWLPYIAKVFPDAKVLFARRDPRDVVLSCFRRRFLINGAMYTFTDLAQGAEFYAGVMALSDVYRRVLELAWYNHRHEDLVDDFEGETRALCTFLELPWTEKLQDFAETARRRDVQTPSAPQVRRGLYREGMGQWRRYAAGLAPALPILQPWVEAFGYDPA